MHVPAGKFTITGDLADTFFVALTKELHADHGKNEDNDGQHQGEISQSPHGIANDLNQHIQSGPGLCQLENSELKTETR